MNRPQAADENKSEFRPVVGAESHEINRRGVIRRRIQPAPGGDGSLCQFGPGYIIRGRGDHVNLSQGGKTLFNTTRRSLVEKTFGIGEAWEKKFCRGEKVPQSKLTAEEVREIRRRKAIGESDASIAADFGLSRSNVWFIIARRTWRHVE